MQHALTPIPVPPWTLNGISGRMIVRHYENHYGSAVRTLNAVRSELVALDVSAPGYHMDFGANATAYIGAFMRNIDWKAVGQRMTAVRADRALPQEDPSDTSLPSISIEELAGR